MHYYKRNIGDYAKKAGRLTMLQHGAYTLLLDACYDRECFPTRDEAIDWAWACTDDEIAAVDVILRRFFVLQDGRYVQTRIEEELATYHQNAEINKRIALEREAKKREQRTNRAPLVHKPSPNHEPVTINHKPKVFKKDPAVLKAERDKENAAPMPPEVKAKIEALIKRV